MNNSNIIAVTISRNADTLDIILPQNYKFFKEWFIVSDINDVSTVDVITKYRYSNLTLLLCDLYIDNSEFDKGGVLRYVQEHIYKRDDLKDICILVIDSDIYLPNDFLDLTNGIHIEENTLYTPHIVKNFFSYDSFLNDTCDIESIYPHNNVYLQLYKLDINYVYSSDCNSTCDVNFKEQFKDNKCIENLSVSHLGKYTNTNRRSINDNFTIDKTYSLQDFLYENNIVCAEGFSQQVPEQIKDLIKLTSSPNITLLEIGFNAGHSSELFLKNNPLLKVTSFDIGEHAYYKKGKEYIDCLYPERLTLIIGDSTFIIPFYTLSNPGKTFDIIFIDGGHDYHIAYADLMNCRKLAHKDTILILDDTVFTPKYVMSHTLGPTKVWKEAIEQGIITEINHGDYTFGRGMSWGKYVFHEKK